MGPMDESLDGVHGQEASSRHVAAVLPRRNRRMTTSSHNPIPWIARGPFAGRRLMRYSFSGCGRTLLHGFVRMPAQTSSVDDAVLDGEPVSEN